MHPDKRRAGRAIRKYRREVRAAMGNFGALAAIVQAGFEAFGAVLEGVGDAFAQFGRALQTPPERLTSH